MLKRIINHPRMRRIWPGTHQINTNQWILPKSAVHMFDRLKRRFIRRYFAFHKIQVTSFGGAGTTMLCRYLSIFGAKMPSITEGDWAPWKHMNYPPEDRAVSSDFKAIYLISDPREALLSVFRRGFQHWLIQRMEGNLKQWDYSWDLETYLKSKSDFFGYQSHFNSWTQSERKYPILTIKYDHMWNHIPEIVEFSGISAIAVGMFPKKHSRRSSLQNVSPEVLSALNSLFEELMDDIDDYPQFQIISPSKSLL